VAIGRELGVPVAGIYDLMSHWETTEGIQTVGFNKGGTITFGEVAVSMVNAVHSSSVGTSDGPMYVGAEAGFMIRGEGHTIYVSGDTDIMADMAWMGEYHAPDIGILCAGGHFTMDMKAAAWAARKFFDFKLVIPCHYRTFPLLAQDAEELRAGLPGVDVREPEVLVEIEV
jgi:L-ascorbate metabolism protein UlaG (beta-lactamase superfamily)